MYDTLVYHYGFNYPLIRLELDNAFIKSDDGFLYKKQEMENGNIDHLPSDFEIEFAIKNLDTLLFLKDKYSFLKDKKLFALFTFTSNFISRLTDLWFNIPKGEEFELGIIPVEQLKVAQYLSERIVPDTNRPFEMEMSIRYGNNETLKVDNTNNWLSKLILQATESYLPKDDTIPKPPRAPQIHNFVVYNTYLLLKDLVGSDKLYPVEFLEFIIDFCEVCEIELIGDQKNALGIKYLIRNAIKRYDNKPIPLSLII